MSRPPDVWAVDTLIGFRAPRNVPEVPALRGRDEGERHPAEYMYKAVPAERRSDQRIEDSVDETVAKMDAHRIGVGLVSLTDPATAVALAAYPDRFVASLSVDANEGVESLRKIVRAVDEYAIRAVTTFPSGLDPQVPISHRHWYPVYAKCAELGLAVFVTTGVPGPRVPMTAQHVEHLDEVCFDFPEVSFVMRHGGEPWVDLAVKLLLKWPNLSYSTSAFAPKHYPRAIIDFANTRGADKVLYAGYFPMGLELARISKELDDMPFRDHVWPRFLRDNARRLLRMDGSP